MNGKTLAYLSLQDFVLHSLIGSMQLKGDFIFASSKERCVLTEYCW